MQNLLYFLFRYGYVLIFFILEVLCFNLVVKYNPHQNRLFLKSSNFVSGWILHNYQSVTQYFGLAKVSQDLAEENAKLLSQQSIFMEDDRGEVRLLEDSLQHQQYELIAAKVISNSITSLDNFLTINKGTEEGIEKGMGIIQGDGVVGIITDVNRKFARAVSLLNRECRISAALARNQFFGTLYWPGGDPRKAKFGDIAKHADLQVGDQIITSGYSTIFPRGVPLGHITNFSLKDGSNFYDINVAISSDLSRVNYVYVVRNLLRFEQLQMQGEIINEADNQ